MCPETKVNLHSRKIQDDGTQRRPATAVHDPDVEPSVPAELSILGISGLSDYAKPQPRLQISPISQQQAQPNSGSGPSGTYMGNDFRAAYVPGASLTGTGQIVGLLQFDGYSASDITAYEAQNGLPNVPLMNVLLDGVTGQPSGGGSGCGGGGAEPWTGGGAGCCGVPCMLGGGNVIARPLLARFHANDTDVPYPGGGRTGCRLGG